MQASQPTNCLIRAGGGGSRAQLKVVSMIVVQWDESATPFVRANRAPGMGSREHLGGGVRAQLSDRWAALERGEYTSLL